MAVPTKESELLEQTIEIINTLGWARGRYQRGTEGAVCTLGGMTLASVNNGIKNYTKATIVQTFSQRLLMDRAATRVTRIARQMFPKSYGRSVGGGIPTFNDFRHRTRQQVLKVLRAAAEEARAAGK